jgi:hypothetical protein
VNNKGAEAFLAAVASGGLQAVAQGHPDELENLRTAADAVARREYAQRLPHPTLVQKALADSTR